MKQYNVEGHDIEHLKATLYSLAETYPSITPQVIKGIAHDALGFIQKLESEIVELRDDLDFYRSLADASYDSNW